MDINEKLSSGREYRSVVEINIAEQTEDDSRMIVRGYATTFDAPYLLFAMDDYNINEQVDSRAFDECDMEDVIFQYDHCGRVFARKSNGTLNLTVDDHGLLVEADLGGTEIGRQLYEEIKGGFTTKMSFGFTVGDEEMTRTQNGDLLRTIRKINKLYDVSAVSLPANDATEISARSYCDGVIAARESERIQRARQVKRIKLLSEV